MHSMLIKTLRFTSTASKVPLRTSALLNISKSLINHRTMSGLRSTIFSDYPDLSIVKKLNSEIRSGGVVPVFRRALLFPRRIAIHDVFGVYSYGGLYHAAYNFSKVISAQLNGKRRNTIAYLCGLDASHVIAQWAIWMSGNIAVPLSSVHPPALLKYYIEDSDAALLICSEENFNVMTKVSEQVSRPLLMSKREYEISAQIYQPSEELQEIDLSAEWYATADALLIYTSGTTSKPKGVVWTHKAWSNQIDSLHAAWKYSPSDVVLHLLPLHHVHGQLNSLSASLAIGARVKMMKELKPHRIWARFLSARSEGDEMVNVFHAVPTVYVKLLDEHANLFASSAHTRDFVRSSLESQVRLMTCGSAPLPATVFEKWEQITGHKLLERYGMSEVGMALGNPYSPMSKRIQSTVGLPFPGVEARIAVHNPDGSFTPLVTVANKAANALIRIENDSKVKNLFAESPKEQRQPEQKVKIEVHQESPDGVYMGELLLKGNAVFQRYWNRPDRTEDFTTDGWFKTGDTAQFKDNRFSIMGRTSVDIIKTGGYKVSAVQVESVLLEHPKVKDAGVVGLPDDTWGERVAALLVLEPESSLDLKELKEWAKEKLANYQTPTSLKTVDSLPRNVMGKLDKKVIVEIMKGK